MIPYRMPRETNAKLVHLEVIMNWNKSINNETITNIIFRHIEGSSWEQ
jgi:hypothetical protein